MLWLHLVVRQGVQNLRGEQGGGEGRCSRAAAVLRQGHASTLAVCMHMPLQGRRPGLRGALLPPTDHTGSESAAGRHVPLRGAAHLGSLSADSGRRAEQLRGGLVLEEFGGARGLEGAVSRAVVSAGLRSPRCVLGGEGGGPAMGPVLVKVRL